MSLDETTESGSNTPGFKVSDRRKFTAEGEPIGADDNPQDARSEPGPATADAPRDRRERRGREEGKAPNRSIDFGSFVLSLATTAMAYLGEIPDPGTGKSAENLEGAQQMIDVLSILQEKTKGNLEEAEEHLIEDLLYELRMKYLAKAKVIHL